MPSTFSGLEIASRALRVSQGLVDITGHNLANVNTPGYSRQTAQTAASEPYTMPEANRFAGPGQLGTGVEMTAVNRARDEFLEAQLLQGDGEQALFTQLQDTLQRVESAYNEPDAGGLSSRMTAFFNSFQELSRGAESSSVRTLVRQQARALARQFNAVDSGLGRIDADLASRVGKAVEQANNLAKQVADLNREIAGSQAAGYHPNDLSDRRDILVRQIGELAGATAVREMDAQGRPTGMVRVLVNGFTLVDGREANALPDGIAFLNGVPQLTDGKDQVPVTAGTVGGLLKASHLLGGYREELNTLAATLISRVNTVHRGGYGLDGVSGRDFFAGTGAADMAVSPEVEGSLDAIAAASPPAAGTTVAPGSGDNALVLSHIGAEVLIGGGTLGSFYAASFARIGSDAQAYGNQAESQKQVMLQLENLRSSVSGVSLDEEMTRLLQYQRAYQAAARLATTMDSMLETMIETLGR